MAQKRIEDIIKDLQSVVESEDKETPKKKGRTRLILPPLPEQDLLSMPVTQLPERCWKRLN